MKPNSSVSSELYAAIDVGSNTIRHLIGSFSGNHINRVITSRAVTRLGKNILKNSLLSKESIYKSISFLKEVKNICELYNVAEIMAVGTSAIREAKNNNFFLEEVKINTGIDIEIITGEREAELTLKGVMSNFDLSHTKILPIKRFFIADIGGGSTEWILLNDFKAKGSLSIGAVKIYETFINHDPPISVEIERLKSHINQIIIDSSLMQSYKSDLTPESELFIVTGGTAASVAAIDLGLSEYDGNKINLHGISRPTLQLLVERLISVPLVERQKVIKGLEPDRADIIITGAFILLSLMEIFEINELIVSDFGLLEGLLIERKPNAFRKCIKDI